MRCGGMHCCSIVGAGAEGSCSLEYKAMRHLHLDASSQALVKKNLKKRRTKLLPSLLYAGAVVAAPQLAGLVYVNHCCRSVVA